MKRRRRCGSTRSARKRFRSWWMRRSCVPEVERYPIVEVALRTITADWARDMMYKMADGRTVHTYQNGGCPPPRNRSRAEIALLQQQLANPDAYLPAGADEQARAAAETRVAGGARGVGGAVPGGAGRVRAAGGRPERSAAFRTCMGHMTRRGRRRASSGRAYLSVTKPGMEGPGGSVEYQQSGRWRGPAVPPSTRTAT